MLFPFYPLCYAPFSIFFKQNDSTQYKLSYTLLDRARAHKMFIKLNENTQFRILDIIFEIIYKTKKKTVFRQKKIGSNDYNN